MDHCVSGRICIDSAPINIGGFPCFNLSDRTVYRATANDLAFATGTFVNRQIRQTFYIEPPLGSSSLFP